MKKILITGGAGFLGTNLCRRLVKDKDHHVYCLDNLKTGKMENIRDLVELANFEFILHDVKHPIDLEVDEIYHAACPASPPAYQLSPTDTTKTCIYGMINLLDLATKYHAKILFFSTSEVYGDPMEHPQKESYWGHVNPDGIRSCYDEGKRCSETLCFDYNREFGTRIKVIRIFNTYGPYMDPEDGRVVSNFINQALRNEKLTVYGTGRQTRSFCYVDDLTEGIIRMMGTKDSVLGPVNLGNPSEFTLLELAEKVLRLTEKAPVQIEKESGAAEALSGDRSIIEYLPLPGDDPRQRKPDIEKAGRLLSWKPETGLDEGIKRTIEYFKGL